MARSRKESEERELSLKVKRATEFKSGDVAFDIDVNGVMIYGCVMKEGRNGNFVAFPSRKGSDGKYYSHVWVALSESDVENINKQIDELL